MTGVQAPSLHELFAKAGPTSTPRKVYSQYSIVVNVLLYSQRRLGFGILTALSPPKWVCDIKKSNVALCAKVIAHRDGSKELATLWRTKRSALKEHAGRAAKGRLRILRKKGLPRTQRYRWVEFRQPANRKASPQFDSSSCAARGRQTLIAATAAIANCLSCHHPG